MTVIGDIMANNNKLSPVEWEIMETIWKLKGSPSVREVLQEAYPNGEKAYTTVQTIMNNLEIKGFLTHKKVGLVNFYTPTRLRETMVKAETHGLVSKVFRGSFAALANYLIKSDSLSIEDIAELKAIIKKHEAKLRE
jgi:BlaI family penicillinase repressor